MRAQVNTHYYANSVLIFIFSYFLYIKLMMNKNTQVNALTYETLFKS